VEIEISLDCILVGKDNVLLLLAKGEISPVSGLPSEVTRYLKFYLVFICFNIWEGYLSMFSRINQQCTDKLSTHERKNLSTGDYQILIRKPLLPVFAQIQNHLSLIDQNGYRFSNLTTVFDA